MYYVTPTEDNIYQADKMKAHGIFSDVHKDVGEIIVADVNQDRIAELLEPDRAALKRSSPRRTDRPHRRFAAKVREVGDISSVSTSGSAHAAAACPAGGLPALNARPLWWPFRPG